MPRVGALTLRDELARSALIATWLLSLALSFAPALHAQSESGGSVELVVDGLDSPSNLASPRDGRERIYFTEQHEGQIRVIADGRVLPEPFLDLGGRLIEEPNVEEGLLGLAFAPTFPTKPYVYVTYINVQSELVLSRFDVASSGLEAIAASERVLLSVQRDERMHHCGHIEFGPKDRLLYLCIGDTQGNARSPALPIIKLIAQDPSSSLGKILRLDVGPLEQAAGPGSGATASASYDVWAIGLRNPWRFTFDPVSGDMFIPDVSRFHWDEIEFWPASAGIGANFGWPLAEGNECIAECDAPDLVWPLYEYAHSDDRCAVIGGAVYRGSAFPEWQGVFVFGDRCSGEIWALRKVDGMWHVRTLADTDLIPNAFGTRFDGEILIADRAGAVWRLMLPDLDDGEWMSVDQAMLAMITDARRAGFSRSRHRLEAILASRSWRWARWIARGYRYLTRPFD